MRSALVVVLAAALGACAGRAPKGEPAAGPPVTVVMRNSNWGTVDVYAVRNGSWAHLAMVPTNREERAELPAWALVGASQLQLKVRVVGSGEVYLTEPILAAAGQEITLDVQPTLRLTSWAVQ